MLTPVAAQQAAPQPAVEEVPKDLEPLLASAPSEMRLVAQTYRLDRATLNGNYQGASGRGGGGRGRGAAEPPPAAPPISLSTARIGRLKRFELDWQAALARLDVDALTPDGRTDLAALQQTIAANLKQLDVEASAMAEVLALAPFAPTLVNLIEARIKLEDVDSKKAAGDLTAVAKAIAAAKPDGDAKFSKAAGARAADAVQALRANLSTWYTFYYGYDPMFTWWVEMPYKKVDAALEGYISHLRQAGVDSMVDAGGGPRIPPAPAPRFNQVPDLQALIKLPYDEMTPIVERFIGARGGGRAATNSPGAGRPQAYYEAWLKALETLEFDRLSRNAQVDYLFIRNAAERHIARMHFTPPANPPRKTDSTGIPGAARGREGLIMDLADEMIPYTPEQLIALANREFAWCEEEMRKASRQMGFGDDWKKAIEKVKDMHVPPGGQPMMIKDLLFEAIDYLRAKDLITVPQVAAESLHMSMMSPEAQLSNPFFLGGSQIIVSYPTNTMEYEARLQSMRGNNRPFSHATAHHEMIPGHNLVGYVGARSAGYRARIGGSTPFFGEGWPLYWELTLYDMGFNDTPEERVGALFWRMHRCARIIFSLNFHMGLWSPQEAIDFLVDRVGHERDNATAEVRRSFQGGYGPLYQAAYLLGGLQLRGLRRELVDSKQMTNKQFHDEILRQGSMPIALIRLALTRQKLAPDMSVDWRFYGDLPSK
ncbi:MAG TPA: DUF885 family protein [Vicinamibacterales bacterium]|nr:DUF885 family protein [Vicinamibacterales bacterium]